MADLVLIPISTLTAPSRFTLSRERTTELRRRLAELRSAREAASVEIRSYRVGAS
jgi:hypothetical protein